jgi:Rieske Fe-S protein
MKTTSLVKRAIAAGIAGVAVMSVGAAIAQTAVSPSTKKPAPAASTPDSSKPVTATEIETWTTTQWEAAKKEWQKDTAKWTGCQAQSNKKKLEGRKSWSFLYTCMTS